VVALYWTPNSNKKKHLYCIVDKVTLNATRSTVVLNPVKGYSENEWENEAILLNVNQKCFVYWDTMQNPGINVMYKPLRGNCESIKFRKGLLTDAEFIGS
jgi:hypothetical protein